MSGGSWVLLGAALLLGARSRALDALGAVSLAHDAFSPVHPCCRCAAAVGSHADKPERDVKRVLPELVPQGHGEPEQCSLVRAVPSFVRLP